MSLTKYSLLWLLIALAADFQDVYAQLPQCDAGDAMLYYLDPGGIYNYDPSQPLSASNPVKNTIPYLATSSGLAVSAPLNSTAIGSTFYTVRNGVYFYYSNGNWINTGHSIGSNAAVNIGAGGRLIFSIDPITNTVYRYDGTTNASPIVTIPGPFNGIADLVADCRGNFYVLNTSGQQRLRKYDKNGNLLGMWPLIGIPSTNGGGGFSIIGDEIFYTNHVNNNLFRGKITCTAITFSPPVQMPWSKPPIDFAECSGCNTEVIGVSTSLYNCAKAMTETIVAGGKGPYTWSVLSGPAIVSGTGPLYSVSTQATSTVLLKSNSICGPITDTFNFILPSASISFDKDLDTIKGCGSFRDTLHALVTHSGGGGISLNYNWTPSAYVITGGNSLNPVVAPLSDTSFVLTVSTPANQGGCMWRDTIRTIVKDRKVTAAFTYMTRYNCTTDTVLFQDQSTGATFFTWTFGDGSSAGIPAPQHTYAGQNSYTVQLICANETCTDSMSRTLDFINTLDVSFAASSDTICQGEMVAFLNTSAYDIAKGPVHFLWSLENGTDLTSVDAQHTYLVHGIYNVRLTGVNAHKCVDSFVRQLVVDPMPAVEVTLSDSIICAGKEINVQASYTKEGNVGLRWEMGDGSTMQDKAAFYYAYAMPGRYAVNLTAMYGHCPDQVVQRDVVVSDPPDVNLGADSLICAEEHAFVLQTLHEEPGGRYLWSSGQNTPSIKISSGGTYVLEVDVNGCRNADTIIITEHTCNCKVSVPNAFTPNSDGRNDVFRAIFPGDCSLKGFALSVFNRWGQEVFSSDKPGAAWDGQFGGIPAEVGTYSYMARYYIDNSRKENILKGNFILIR